MESFGARLKREREQRKITLDDVSVSTKIATKFIVALEEEHFDQLPGGIFNKGFVRAYARHLGIDENQAIADFVAASAPSLPEIPPEETPVLAAMAVRVPESKQKSRSNDGFPWGMVAAGLLIIAFAFALWGYHSREKRDPRVGAQKPVQIEQTPPATPQTASPAPQPPSTGPSAGAPEAATPAAAPATQNRSIQRSDQGSRGFLGQHHGRWQPDHRGHAPRGSGKIRRSPQPDRDQEPATLARWISRSTESSWRRKATKTRSRLSLLISTDCALSSARVPPAVARGVSPSPVLLSTLLQLFPFGARICPLDADPPQWLAIIPLRAQSRCFPRPSLVTY